MCTGKRIYICIISNTYMRLCVWMCARARARLVQLGSEVHRTKAIVSVLFDKNGVATDHRPTRLVVV